MKEEPKDALWFCSADVMPRTIRGTTREALAAIGFVFREDHDKNYVSCALPVGWVKKPSGTWHAILENNHGNIRAYVYLGMDGGDPVCVSFVTRFSFYQGKVVDGRLDGQVVYAGRDREGNEQWLDAHYPDWRNSLAYWEEEAMNG